MSEKNKVTNLEFVQAENLEEVRADKIVKELTQKRGPSSKALNALRGTVKRIATRRWQKPQAVKSEFVLRNRIIVGEVDLRNRTIDTAVTIQNCIFRDKVDLTYCEFKQTVDLTGCTFCEEFISGDEGAAYTVYRKDLKCNGVLFKGDVRFVGARVEGDAYFSRAILQAFNGEPSTTKVFTIKIPGLNASTCKIPTFEGKADFSAFRCSGYGFFEGARFDGKEKTDFRRAWFGRALDCQNVLFKGPVSFNAIRCDEGASFRKAKFAFEEPTRNVEERTKNDFDIDFTGGYFGGQLIFRDTFFKGAVNFNAIGCARAAIFSKAQFASQKPVERDFAVSFARASFDRQLICRNAWFRGATNFNGVKCGDLAVFAEATFTGRVSDFQFLYVGRNLNLEHAYFDTDVKLGHAHVAAKLMLTGFCFMRQVEIYDAKIRILELLDVNHDSFPIEVRTTESNDLEPIVKDGEGLKSISKRWESLSNRWTPCTSTFRRTKTLWKKIVNGIYPFRGNTLNLSNTTFERFHGGPDPLLEKTLALKFAEGQDRETFSRDPYVQLERFYASEGNDAEAKNVYYEGRCAYRRAAQKGYGGANWTWGTNILDWLWKTLTNYGISLQRLLLISFAFLIIGTVVFHAPNDTLVHTKTNTASPSGAETTNALASSGEEQSASGTEQPPPSWQYALGYRIAYSLDQFLPLVNLHIDEKWEPNGPWLHAYSVVHAIVGWLVVPLLIAALAGIIKR